jgi:ABC-type sugar transport system substrate-binding protein
VGNGDATVLDMTAASQGSVWHIASITIRSGNRQREAAAALFKGHSAENPKNNGAWCANDIMAIGVADAVEARGSTRLRCPKHACHRTELKWTISA